MSEQAQKDNPEVLANEVSKELSIVYDSMTVTAESLREDHLSLIDSGRNANGAGITLCVAFIVAIYSEDKSVEMLSLIPLWCFSLGIMISASIYLRRQLESRRAFMIRANVLAGAGVNIIERLRHGEILTTLEVRRAFRDLEAQRSDNGVRNYAWLDRFQCYGPGIFFIAGVLSALLYVSFKL